MQKSGRSARSLRRARVRKRVRGTGERPRLCVFRSGRHTYAQVITDDDGRTLLAVSTQSKAGLGGGEKAAGVEAAKRVGMLIAEQCRARGIERIVFDRNGFLYHGRVRAVAEGAREGGLEF